MLSALDEAGDKVYAWDCEKGASFVCPGCREDLILRKGVKVVHHFAHKAASVCRLGGGETWLHMGAKKAIYRILAEMDDCSAVEMEKDFGSVRADVYFRMGMNEVVVEIQHSNIALEEIDRRTKFHADHGRYILWVRPYDATEADTQREAPPLALLEGALGKEKRVAEWEAHLQHLYFGRMYYVAVNGYWAGHIISVHWVPVSRHVPVNSFYESDGTERVVGGYSKKLKATKGPMVGHPLHLVADFKGTVVQEALFRGKTMPRRMIWIDRNHRWW